ncbi:Protein FAR1-RELATED SEQUENCE [Arachis hypogaea]|nr:Protein FAR1-RELATED SEQUENCE [Arachis hypogaea]
MEKQSQQEYTTSMFRDVQVEFVKKDDCRASVVTEDWPVVRMKVEEEKLVDDTMICVSYVVHFDRSTQEVRCECNLFESSGVLCCHCLEVFHLFKVYKVPSCYVLPRWSKNIKRKHSYIKSSHNVSRSDLSHNAFKGLCAHFYNIAQEFINDEDETNLLHAPLEETRAKLSEHRAKKRSESVAENHTSIGSQHSNVLDVVDIQAPSLVTTKGRPKSKRLGSNLEKSFKKSSQRKNKNASSVVRSNTYQDTSTGDLIARTVPEQVGSFMSLLSSFDKS